jgi:hypothetical protein
MRSIHIGSGAGYSGDRIEPAVELAEHGNLDYLGTISASSAWLSAPSRSHRESGFATRTPVSTRFWSLAWRRRSALARRAVFVSSPTWAPPIRRARRKRSRTSPAGSVSPALKIAAVGGDDVLRMLAEGEYPLLERPGTVADLGERVASANAYMGVAGLPEALRQGADVVVTGGVGDPALFLAPLIHEFGWALDDWDKLGKGTVVGHLLECAGQITGGYFADPGYKDVPDLARLGFPIAEVSEDGSAVITKVEGSGGRVSVASCKEQLLYELLDPTGYLQPDVTADFSAVRFTELGPNRVAVSGGTGRARPDTLKVSVGYRDSYVGEGQMSYAGPGAVARARLALEIVRERLRLTGIATTETRFELIGVDAVRKGGEVEPAPDLREVRIRVAARTDSMAEAIRVGNEVESLYTNGPAGGGGAWKSARQIVAVVSTLLPQHLANPTVHFEVA